MSTGSNGKEDAPRPDVERAVLPVESYIGVLKGYTPTPLDGTEAVDQLDSIRNVLARARYSIEHLAGEENLAQAVAYVVDQWEACVEAEDEMWDALSEFVQHDSWRCDHPPHFYLAGDPPKDDCACGLVSTLRNLGLPADEWMPKSENPQTTPDPGGVSISRKAVSHDFGVS